MATADPLEGQTIRCALELAGDGRLLLTQEVGCTAEDARELCALVARPASGIEVVDLTS